MKQAAINDLWRRVSVRDKFQFKLTNIQLNGFISFKDINIDINSSITAICGKNGIGKSSLLKLLLKVINAYDGDLKCFRADDYTGINLSAIYRGSPISYVASGSNKFINSEYFDASALSIRIINEINSDPEKNGWFNTSTQSILDADDIYFIKKVTGKQYKEINIHEISDIIDDLTFPYFEVKLNDLAYSSENMGQGEHKILVTIWKLITAEQNSIIFLEEPESFICPASQKRFMDFLAYASCKKSLHIILATHSEHITNSISLNSVLVLNKIGNKFFLDKSICEYAYFNALGLTTEKNNVYLVEDAFAKLFLERILKRNAVDLYASSLIHVLGGESNICEITKHYKGNHDGLNFIAIYDADQSHIADDGSRHIRKAFLPSLSNFSPEKEVITASYHCIDRLSLILQVTTEELQELISEIATIEDEHDFFIELNKKIPHIELSQIKNSFIDVWIEKNQEIIEIFIFELKNINNDFSVKVKSTSEIEKIAIPQKNESITLPLNPRWYSFNDGLYKAILQHDPDKKRLICELRE